MIKTLLSCKAVLLPLLFILTLSSVAQKTQQQLDESRKKLTADPSVKSVQFSEVLKTPSSISFTPGTQNRSTVAASLKKYFELSESNNIRLISSTEMKGNITVDKYQQFFKGIIVEHSAYSVISKGSDVISVTSESYPLPETFSTAPLQSAEGALAKALNFYNAKKYVWDALEEDKKRFPGNFAAQQRLESMRKLHLPKGQLVIAKDVYGDGQAHLAFKFDIYALEPVVSRYKIYVDAFTGKILLRDAVIKHVGSQKTKQEADPQNKLANYQFYNLIPEGFIPSSTKQVNASELGTALTRYSGIRQIYTTKVIVPLTGKPDPNNPNAVLTYSGVDPRQPVTGATVFILKDQTRGEGIETYDLNGVGGAPLSLPGVHDQALAFVDRDNIWQNEADNGVVTKDDLIRGATFDGSNGANEAFNDDIAIDAHWGAEMVYDYWKKRHNRASFDNKNSAIKSYIHYGPAYDNAFWNGSSMTYGDGSGTAANGFRPLVSLDVCGHEVGHGVCSFTSDLVYESESGAMNEGLSDIWAAAVENYVDDSVKFSATPTYQYFQIGENISADNVGIRRMDNPKAKTDPDTYGGRYWANPNCTPTLVNDQCGVHTNSGVLNKWFYLVVMGPNQLTGSPSYTDDGRADAGTTAALENLGNNYGAVPGFIGIGFERAEEITYLMEQMLTPNATFAQARTASILAAQTLFGICSQQERTITNAWFGVGVGAAFTTCTAPLLTVVPTTTNVGEGAPGDCPRYTDLKINSNLTVAQGASTPITFTVEPGGTLGVHEYQLLTNTVTYNAGETGLKSTPVLRIFDDAVFEVNETITITASAPSVGYTNTFTITVRDNDTLPTIGGIYTLLSENFETTADGAIPTGWGRIDRVPAIPPIQWNVRSNGTIGFQWVGKRLIVEQKLIPGQATYDQNVESQIIVRTPLINGTGLDSLKLEFTYQAGGEPLCTPACDYGKIMYSYDGTVFTSMFPEDTVMYVQLTDRRARYDIPQQLSNRQFYIGFLWHNDANAGLTASITIDDVLITGKGKRIATDSLSVVTEPIPSIAQEGSSPSFLYSRYDAALLSKIVNASNNLGCVKDTLVQSGNGFVAYSGGLRSRKVHEITPSQNSNSSYTLTLYYTNAELAGQNPSSLRLMKSNAANIDASNSSNSVIVATSVEDHSADGYWSYTATFSGFSLYALVTSAPPPGTPVTYYPRTSATDLSQLSNWTDDPAGTAGTSPPNFTSPNQQFNITRNPFVTGAWIISGGSNVTLMTTGLTFNSSSSLTVGTGSNFDFGGNSGYSTTFKSTQASTASLLPVSGTVTNSNNVTVERFISAASARSSWRLLTAPLSGTTNNSVFTNWQNAGVNTTGRGTTVTGPTYSSTGAPGSPVSDVNGLDYSTPGYSLKSFDITTQQLLPVTNTRTTPLFDAKNNSFFIFINGDRFASSGNPNTTTLSATGNLQIGDKTFVTSTAADGYTLIGNPYASPVDLNLFRQDNTASNIKSNYYYWDPYLTGAFGVGGYVTVSYDGSGNETISPAAVNHTRHLQSGQAMFVQTKNPPAGAATVTFRETQKSNTVVNNIFRTQTGNIESLEVNLTILSSGTAVLLDGIVAKFDNSYNAAVDNYDAAKMYNIGESIAFMRENKVFSIERRPLLNSDDVLFLNLINLKAGREYQFEFIPDLNVPGLTAWLKDSYLQATTPIDVKAKSSIRFTVTGEAASTGANRFSIGFAKPAIVQAVKPGMSVYPNPVTNGIINLQMNNMPQGIYNVRVLNSMGQVVTTRQINHAAGSSTETIKLGKGALKGVYHLEVLKPDNSKFSSKVIAN